MEPDDRIILEKEGESMMEGDENVKAGSLNRLVEKLTTEEKHGELFVT